MKKNNSAQLVGLMVATNIYSIFHLIIYRSLNDYWGEIWRSISLILVGAFATAMAWRAQKHSSEERLVWRLLGVGLGLWTVGEVMLALLTLFLSEVTYPSIADILGCLGYLPVGAAILIHLAHYRRQISIWRLAMAVSAGAIFFFILYRGVLEPMFYGYALTQDLGSMFNVLYPILDVMLVIGACAILLTLGPRRWWQPWLFIGIALVMWAYADATFAFLTWIDAYTAKDIGLIVVDLPYNMAYLMFGIGCWQAVATTSESFTMTTTSPLSLTLRRLRSS